MPTLIKLLPVDIEDMPEQEEDNVLMNYEPDQEEALEFNHSEVCNEPALRRHW